MPGHLCENKQNAQKVKNKKQKRQNTPNTITAWPEMAGNGVAGLLSDRARGAFLAKCQGIFAKTSRKPKKQENKNRKGTTRQTPLQFGRKWRRRAAIGSAPESSFGQMVGHLALQSGAVSEPKTNECPESVLSENPPAEIALGRLARRNTRAGLLAIGTFSAHLCIILGASRGGLGQLGEASGALGAVGGCLGSSSRALGWPNARAYLRKQTENKQNRKTKREIAQHVKHN
jgi:hypothetical protein